MDIGLIEAGHVVMAVLSDIYVRYVAVGRFARPYEGIVLAAGGREIRHPCQGIRNLV